MSTKYWIVGANFGASWDIPDTLDQKFVSKGIWMLGQTEGDQPEQAQRISIGDRIAIKRLVGGGDPGMRILHIGIVRGKLNDLLDADQIIFTVNWVVTNLDRVVDSGGCFSAINGPYTKSNPQTKVWLEEIFSL